MRCGTDDRQALEQLCRYITRPALANERVQTNAPGQVVLKLKTPWRGAAKVIVDNQKWPEWPEFPAFAGWQKGLCLLVLARFEATRPSWRWLLIPVPLPSQETKPILAVSCGCGG